ncbi:hypothetical protein PYK79_31750 [Streptomyces sp. ID05-04B]|uniref:hypothetical protein n=1 Tax=Streptomyces sp. ID05-04B TaxID=3028661 RepID=UPI0029C14505|nr:hypothetical protein [Streptomyces sp. ID05-04B]MDX5566908.1 hypothetical protein [Streptomyces sp. ID05-04B]
MGITQTAIGKIQQPPVWCGQLEATGIPVDLSAGTGVRLLRAILPDPTLPGDVLDISWKVGVTNNAGYPNGTRFTIGVGAHLFAYPYPDPAGWANRQELLDENGDQILVGMNVTPDVHHLALAASISWRVPADWGGSRMGLALVVDAHSTAWKVNGGNDILTVEPGYAQLRVHRWTDPIPA